MEFRESVTSEELTTLSTVVANDELLDRSNSTGASWSIDADKRRKHDRCFAPIVSAAALLISLGAMALIMWFVSHESQRRSQLPISDAVKQSREAVIGDGSANVTTASQPTSAMSTVTTTTTTTTRQPQPAKPRAFECQSHTVDNTWHYPMMSNVTKWRKSELDEPCPTKDDRSPELFIEEEGNYFLYSQAWHSGGMDKGVVLKQPRGEYRDRPLRMRHRIVCWRNCSKASDATGAMLLREAELIALDVFNTHVSVLVRLRSGSAIGVMVTSTNVTDGHNSGWTQVVLGAMRVS